MICSGKNEVHSDCEFVFVIYGAAVIQGFSRMAIELSHNSGKSFSGDQAHFTTLREVLTYRPDEFFNSALLPTVIGTRDSGSSNGPRNSTGNGLWLRRSPSGLPGTRRL